jgi:hypothetical protein
VVTSGKLMVVLAMALVLGQLQCAAWCAVRTCDLTDLNHAGTQNVPPCHRHQDDSSQNRPAGPCAHGVVIASPADVSAARGTATPPAAAILAIQPEASLESPISSNASAVLSASAFGPVGRPFAVLRI